MFCIHFLKKWQLFVYILATLGAFGCGTGIAWSAPVLPKVQPEDCQDSCDLSGLSDYAASWIGPLFPLGAACSGPVAFFLLNQIGRKRTLILLSFPMFIGYVLLTLTKTLDSIVTLFIGRFFVGKFLLKYFNIATYIKIILLT